MLSRCWMEKMTMKELVLYCKEKGWKGYSQNQKTKKQLIQWMHERQIHLNSESSYQQHTTESVNRMDQTIRNEREQSLEERTNEEEKEEKKPKKGLKRDTVDKFYTNPRVVDDCIDVFKQHIDVDKERDIVIEPSAGNGAFIAGIRSLSHQCLFYDLVPEHPDVVKQDYLEFELESDASDVMSSKKGKVHVIGNPPFGRQASLAKKFIKKSSSFADSVSFILPKSFKKDSFKQSFPLSFHLIHEVDVPDNSFLVDGKPYDVHCVFQIWQRRSHDEQRIEKKKEHPIGYAFVKRSDHPDLAFRRVGVNAGTIATENIHTKSEQSHYFIQLDPSYEPMVKRDMIEKIKGIQYESDNTVGPKSISKQELIAKFNPLFFTQDEKRSE